MRLLYKAVFVSLTVFVGIIAQIAQAGVIQGASGMPSPITAGATYTLSVTGITGSFGGLQCDGLTIDWGDSPAPNPTGLIVFPFTTTHVFSFVSVPTIRTVTVSPAGGTCTGSATTTVTVNPAPGVIGSIAGPANATVGAPISITVNGTGLCGSMNISWGDGAEPLNNYNLASPIAINHTYLSSGPKTITVTGTASCGGSANHNLTVSDPPGVITTINGAATATQNAPYSITVSGAGVCGNLSVDWGDGNTDPVNPNYNLASPVSLSHTYTTVSPPPKTITVTGTASCSGSDTHSVTVNPPPPGPGMISTITGPSTAYRNVTTAWGVSGTGTCGTMSITWGDGSLAETATGYNLLSPTNLTHKYTALGIKTISVSSGASCSGSAVKNVEVINFARPDLVDFINLQLRWRIRYRVPCYGPPCPFPPGPVPPGPCLSCPRMIDQIKQVDADRARLLTEAKTILDQVGAGKLTSPAQVRNAESRLTYLALALKEGGKKRDGLLRAFDAEVAKMKARPAPPTLLQRAPMQLTPIKSVPENKMLIK